MGAMRMPAIAATAALIIQLAAATRSGAMRLTSAPFSVSAAARVCSPKRVKRKASVITIAMPRTAAANHTRSLEIRMEPRVQTFVGRIASTDTGAVPSRCDMSPVITTMTPIDATALATAGAARNGRNTTR